MSLLGCTFHVFSPTGSKPELTSDSRTRARSRGRCGRSPVGRSAGSRIPGGARTLGLMLQPGTALQGTETAELEPALAQPCLSPAAGGCSRNPGDFMALGWETATTPLSRLWERSSSCLLPPSWNKAELKGGIRISLPPLFSSSAADSEMQGSGGKEGQESNPSLEG